MHDTRDFAVIGGLTHRTSRGHLLMVEALAKFDPEHKPIGRYCIAYRYFIDGNEASPMTLDPVRLGGDEFLVLQHGISEPVSWHYMPDPMSHRSAAWSARATGYCLPYENWLALVKETERKVDDARSDAFAEAEKFLSTIPPPADVSLEDLALGEPLAWATEQQNQTTAAQRDQVVQAFLASGCREADAINLRAGSMFGGLLVLVGSFQHYLREQAMHVIDRVHLCKGA